MHLVPLLVMYRDDENRQSCKYWKFTAASAQNGDFYCKKRSFALLLLTNPLPYTIRHNIAMELVAMSGLLPLTLGQQRVIIMVISIIFFFSDFGWRKFEFQKNTCRRSAKFQNFKRAKSVVFDPPWETPSFLLLHTLYAIAFHFNTSNLL